MHIDILSTRQNDTRTKLFYAHSGKQSYKVQLDANKGPTNLIIENELNREKNLLMITILYHFNFS